MHENTRHIAVKIYFKLYFTLKNNKKFILDFENPF